MESLVPLRLDLARSGPNSATLISQRKNPSSLPIIVSLDIATTYPTKTVITSRQVAKLIPGQQKISFCQQAPNATQSTQYQMDGGSATNECSTSLSIIIKQGNSLIDQQPISSYVSITQSIVFPRRIINDWFLKQNKIEWPFKIQGNTNNNLVAWRMESNDRGRVIPRYSPDSSPAKRQSFREWVIRESKLTILLYMRAFLSLQPPDTRAEIIEWFIEDISSIDVHTMDFENEMDRDTILRDATARRRASDPGSSVGNPPPYSES